MAATFPDRGEILRELLARFLDSPAGDVDAALERLYAEGIEPRAASILRNKLRVSLRPDDDSYVNQTARDLLSDVKAALLPVVRRLRDHPNERGIADFDSYVRVVVTNSYHQHLRDKYPRRISLRNKIRYILSHRPGSTIERGDHGEYLCGVAPISGEPVSLTGVDLTVPAGIPREENARIIAIVDHLFETAGGSLRLEELVAAVWQLMNFKEHESLSDSDPAFEVLPSTERDLRLRFDDVEHLKRIWAAILDLPVNHRRALLLNLTDGHGENLTVLFPALTIASIRQVADALEFGAEELAEIWGRLPLEDNAIAEMLQVTRQQVINLRHTARARLRRTMK